MSEQTQFLDSLGDDQKQTVDILEESLNKDDSTTPEEGLGATGATADDDDDGQAPPKNRRERRLMKSLEDERKAAAFLAGKLEARSEAERTLTEESDYLKAVERIYGTETPEAQLATDLLKKAIVGARDEGKELALAELRAERERERAEEADASSELDAYIEDIEDTYNVTLTDAQQRSYFQLLQKMSPKDRDGNVVAYADPHAVWDVFQDKLQKKGTDNRAKSLSSRSMTQSGASKDSTLQDDTAARFLKEEGII